MPPSVTPTPTRHSRASRNPSPPVTPAPPRVIPANAGILISITQPIPRNTNRAYPPRPTPHSGESRNPSPPPSPCYSPPIIPAPPPVIPAKAGIPPSFRPNGQNLAHNSRSDSEQ